MDISYADCRQALREERATVGAAECHGVLCGMLCGEHDFDPEDWLEEILGAIDPVGLQASKCITLLLGVMGEAVRELNSEDCDFTPLLPADNEPLAVRSQALAEWCNGFLYGIGMGGSRLEALLSSDAREILADFSEVSRLIPAEQESDAEEADYVEIVEYVRVGVMLIYTELRLSQPAPDASDRLH